MTTPSVKPSPLRVLAVPPPIMAERWLGELEDKGYEALKADYAFAAQVNGRQHQIGAP
jgi:hypothetical protein